MPGRKYVATGSNRLNVIPLRRVCSIHDFLLCVERAGTAWRWQVLCATRAPLSSHVRGRSLSRWVDRLSWTRMASGACSQPPSRRTMLWSLHTRARARSPSPTPTLCSTQWSRYQDSMLRFVKYKLNILNGNKGDSGIQSTSLNEDHRPLMHVKVTFFLQFVQGQVLMKLKTCNISKIPIYFSFLNSSLRLYITKVTLIVFSIFPAFVV